jgi:hypothetical protein
MTPQEKAKELFDKYEYFVRMYNDDTPRLDMQKQCALIAVDEILNLCWNGNLKAKEYWQEVKQEIEKL